MTRLYSLLVCVLLCCCARADARRLGEISSKLVLSDSEDAIPEQFIVRFGNGVRETEVKQKAATFKGEPQRAALIFSMKTASTRAVTELMSLVLLEERGPALRKM